jgi:hypothetical protein
MALTKSAKRKRKLVESDSAPHINAKRIQAPKSAPAKDPDDIEAEDRIEEASGSGSPTPRRRKKAKESPLKVLRNGKAISAIAGGRGGGRGRGIRATMKNAVAEVLAMADALKAAAEEGAQAIKPVAEKEVRNTETCGVKTVPDTVCTPPLSPSGGVHINFFLSPTSPLLQESQLVSGRVLRSEGNSGVVTGTPIRSPLPPRCLIPTVSPSVANPEPTANAPDVVPLECPLRNPFTIPVVDTTPIADHIQCPPGSTVAQNPTPIAPTPPVSGNAGPSHSVDSTPRDENIQTSPVSNVAQNRTPVAPTPPVSVNAGPSNLGPDVDARPTSPLRPQPTTSLSYLLSFMPEHEKRSFLSKHPKARLSISSSPVPIESHGAADSHYSANTKGVEDVRIVSSIPSAPPVPHVEFPCASQPQAGGPSLQVEGEKEQYPNSADDVQIVYSKPPAPPVPDVEFPCECQPEAGGPSLQVEGDTELIPPSTSCLRDAPHSKPPAKYKMKALREKKKKNTRRRADHLKHCRRFLKAIWGRTVGLTFPNHT